MIAATPLAAPNEDTSLTMKHEPIVNQASIFCDRFDLRPVRRSDVGLLALYTGDARVAQMTSNIPHPLPPGATEAFVSRAMADKRDEHVWVIDGTKAGGAEVMGVIAIKPLGDARGEIGYWTAPPLWNTGLAREALGALIQENPLHLNALFASVFQDNTASARVLTHCRFSYLGDAESFSVARNARVPTWTYSRKLG